MHGTEELAGDNLGEHRASGGTGTFTGDCNPDGTWGIGAPELDFRGSYAYFFGESCDVSDPWPPQITFHNANHTYTEDDQTYTRHAETKLKLLTAGRAVPHGMCLFKISGEAREILDNRVRQPPTIAGAYQPSFRCHVVMANLE